MGLTAIVGWTFLCLGLTWLGVHRFRQWSVRRNLLDIPNERSSHVHPVPVGGGIVVAVVILVFSSSAMVMMQAGATWVTWAVAAALVAAVSWWDDVAGLSAGSRLGVHSVAAAVVVWMCATANPSLLPSDTAGMHATRMVLGFLWIVGLTNAYNFMDGIDGLAGGQGVIAGVAIGAAGWLTGDGMLVVLGLSSAGASAGFLLHNWAPARMFMGDVGSAFLGFSFAAAAYIAAGSQPAVLQVALLSLWPFLFDSILTFLHRLARRENVFGAHRSHLYQRLVISGCSHASVSCLYMVLAGIGAVLGLASLAGVTGAGWGSLLAVGAMGTALWATVVSAERKSRRGMQE